MNKSNTPISYEGVSSKTAVIILTVSIVVSFLIVASNFATILTFLINRHLRRRSVNCLIHLALVDMVHGVLRIIFEVFVYDFFIGNRVFSSLVLLDAILSIHDLTFAMCLFSLVLVSLERTYATFFPFKYRTIQLKSYIRVYTATWLLAVMIIGAFIRTRSMLKYNNTFASIAISVCFVCLIIICTLNTAILHSIKHKSKQLNPSQHKTSIRRKPNREQHLAITLVMVSLLSLITWLPWIVAVSVVWWHTKYISFIGYKVVIMVQLTNSLINPVVYIIRMRDFRIAIAKLFFRCSRDLQRSHSVQ